MELASDARSILDVDGSAAPETSPRILLHVPDTPLPSPSDRLALMLMHVGVAHRIGARGRIAFASEPETGWVENMVANSSRALREHLAAADPQYLSQHRFSFRRHTGCVEAVCSVWWDLDFRGKDRHGNPLPFADHDLEEVVAIVLYVIASVGLPPPSYVTDSGTGCHVIWTLRGLDKDAMKRWRALMKALRGPRLDDAGNPRARDWRTPDAYEVAWTQRMLPLARTLRDLGLDHAASDPARVLRLWGSVSPKNGRLVRCAWPSSIEDIEPVDFNRLCDAAFPLTREQLRALRKDRAAAREANPDAIPAPRASRPRVASGAKWATVRHDLMALLEHRGAAWFQVNKRRDLWCLHMAVALSQTEGGDAQTWAEQLGPLVGQPVHELTTALSGVERGMHAHAAGETIDYEGDIRPAFYDYHPARIAFELLVTDDEFRDLGLRIVRPEGMPAMTPADRQRRRRARLSPDSKGRDEKAQDRLDLGRRAWWMRISGLTVAECALELGCSVSSVERAIAEADAHADGIVSLETVSTTPVSVQDDAVAIPSVVSRLCIVPEGAPLPPASTPRRIPPAAAQRPSSAPRTPAASRIASLRTPYDRSSAPPAPLVASGDAWGHGRYSSDPRAADELVATVMGLLRAEEARDRRRTSRNSRRSSHPVRLAPLDPAREAEAYADASGGFSTPRRRHEVLVAA